MGNPMKLPLLLNSLADSAIQTPRDIAIISDSVTWSYEQLYARIQQFEEALIEIGIPTNAPVAVLAYKTVETLSLMLALGRKGHSTLVVSPGLGSNVKPTMYFQAGVNYELSASSASSSPLILVTCFPDFKADSGFANGDEIHTSLMMTTSGSTGIPKVVELSAESISAFIKWGGDYFKITRASRVLSYAPLNFDLSLLEIWMPLACGATVILADIDRATQADYLKSLVCNYQPDLIQAVPMFYALLCQKNEPDRWVSEGTRHVIFTGDMTPLKLRQQVVTRFPLAIFHNVYGCTETNDSFVYSVNAQVIVRDERLFMGLPVKGSTFRIVTENGDELQGVGEGELYTSTPFLARGYTDPDLTTRAFFVDPSDQRIYYRTGDQVARDDTGQMTLLGRNDFIVKVRGVRTNMLDIEQVLMTLPEIKSAVIIPVNDETAGVVLHAVVEPVAGKILDGMSLRMHCSRNLAHTSIPKRFHLYDSPLPVTSTGKPDRRTIATSIQAQRSEPA
jgi:acyl-coenzyme A synthetase/AMP-(fatty) acid ligase